MISELSRKGQHASISEICEIRTVGKHKAISHNGDRASRVVPAIYLVPQARNGPEVLQIAIQGVGEVQILVDRVHDGIVERAELAAKVVVKKHGGVVGLDWAHEYDLGGVFRPSALRHVRDLASVVRGSWEMISRGALGDPLPPESCRDEASRASLPFGLMTVGFDGTTSTVTKPVALVVFLTASACDREIFWMMADLLSPVPAARAPAFWTKKTSSVGSYLHPTSQSPHGHTRTHSQQRQDPGGLESTNQTTASWYRGSVATSDMRVRVGLEPMTE